MLISQHLNLDVPWTLNEPLDINVAVLERRRGFIRSGLQRMPQLCFRAHDAHAPAATAGRCFYNHRKTNFTGYLDRLILRIQHFSASRSNRDTGRLHRAPGFNLVAHQLNHAGPRTDELDVAGFADLGKIGGLSQEPVTRMDGVNIENLGGADDGGNVQVALR